MDKKTQGAWIIHHAKKLQETTNQDFDQLGFAGKCGILLSSMAAGTQVSMPVSRVEALARSSNISPRAELPTVLAELERQKLIARSSSSVEVLGLTTHKVLDYTALIFEEGNPTSVEHAAIEIADAVSDAPAPERELVEFASD